MRQEGYDQLLIRATFCQPIGTVIVPFFAPLSLLLHFVQGIVFGSWLHMSVALRKELRLTFIITSRVNGKNILSPQICLVDVLSAGQDANDCGHFVRATRCYCRQRCRYRSIEITGSALEEEGRFAFSRSMCSLCHEARESSVSVIYQHRVSMGATRLGKSIF